MKKNNHVPSMHGNYFKTAGKASEVATCEVLRDRQECAAVLANQTAAVFKNEKHKTVIIHCLFTISLMTVIAKKV